MPQDKEIQRLFGGALADVSLPFVDPAIGRSLLKSGPYQIMICTKMIQIQGYTLYHS